jgi:hypothetical protein
VLIKVRAGTGDVWTFVRNSASDPLTILPRVGTPKFAIKLHRQQFPLEIILQLIGEICSHGGGNHWPKGIKTVEGKWGSHFFIQAEQIRRAFTAVSRNSFTEMETRMDTKGKENSKGKDLNEKWVYFVCFYLRIILCLIFK